jgi:hypothetical protein
MVTFWATLYLGYFSQKLGNFFTNHLATLGLGQGGYSPNFIMLSVIMLIVTMLTVIILLVIMFFVTMLIVIIVIVIMLFVTILKVIMFIIIMLIVIMLSVVVLVVNMPIVILLSIIILSDGSGCCYSGCHHFVNCYTEGLSVAIVKFVMLSVIVLIVIILSCQAYYH